MTLHEDLRASDEFSALLATSERLGANALQVQGPGGNTSLKRDGAMWVKASGTWLAEARERDIMVPVDAARMVAAIEADDPLAADAAAFVIADLNATGLRGSIETSVHAALSWPVVLHTHCVATIATAVRADADAVLRERLDGLDAVFIPYVKPGLDLARSIRARITPQTRTLVLGNHGLVVCGPSAADAESRLLEVSARLEPDALPEPSPVDAAFAARLQGSGWQAVSHGPTQAVAHDRDRLALADGTTLYPDHLIFLGPGVAIGEPGEDPDALCDRASGDGPPRKLLIFAGEGVAIPADATAAMQAMAVGFGDVMARIAPGTALNRLTPQQEHALINWDAEKHRQALDRAVRS